MNRIKVGSQSIGMYATTPKELIDDIQACEKWLRDKGATEVQVDYDIRDYSDSYALYLDGYRKATPDEEAELESQKEKARLAHIASLNAQLKRLQTNG